MVRASVHRLGHTYQHCLLLMGLPPKKSTDRLVELLQRDPMRGYSCRALSIISKGEMSSGPERFQGAW